jgi:hypothetical protein
MIHQIRRGRTELAAVYLRHNVRRLDLFGSAVGTGFDPATSDLDFLVEFGSFPKGGYSFVNTDPVSVLMKHADDFAPRGIQISSWLASGLVEDALELGCRQATVNRCAAWVLVSAEANWVNRGTGARLEIKDVFSLLLFRGSGEKPSAKNPARYEGAVRMYADDIVVFDGQLVYLIKGKMLPEEYLAIATSQPFCVAVRVEKETWSKGDPGNID